VSESPGKDGCQQSSHCNPGSLLRTTTHCLPTRGTICIRTRTEAACAEVGGVERDTEGKRHVGAQVNFVALKHLGY
jgi:hypothetical protein